MQSLNRKTFVWGAGSKLRILLSYLQMIDRNADYVYDPFVKEIKYKFQGIHFTSEKEIKDYATLCDSFVVAIGGEHGKKRQEIALMLKSEYGLKSLTLIHSSSYICNTAKTGEGLMMMPGSVINSFSSLGDNCIVNTNASIDHECVIGNGVHIMGGAVVTGRVHIGDYSSIGSNATVLPDIRIGKNVIVGAGSVVTKNIPDGLVVFGNPARTHKVNI